MKAYGNPASLERAAQQVLFEQSADGIARITLNRPEKHNAMTVPMRARLMELLQRCEADDDVLDRYERQRRHVAIQHSQADTIRNKRVLAEKDPAVRKANHDRLRQTAEDPKLARAFLLRSSLIESIREADQIL